MYPGQQKQREGRRLNSGSNISEIPDPRKKKGAEKPESDKGAGTEGSEKDSTNV
jgi:hypothetical protein